MNPTDENTWTVVAKKHKKEKMNLDTKKKPPINKATQSLITKETMTIEPDMVGFVTGYKGWNLERLKYIYGVKFILPPKGGSQMMIEGPTNMVSAARKDIEQNLLCETRFFIEKDYIPFVIGQEGERVHAMEDALNVCIDIQEGGEVSVTGARCEEAKKAIEEILSRKTSFFIEKDICHLAMGQKGENIWALRKAHNVDINRKKNGEVVIIGEERVEAKKD